MSSATNVGCVSYGFGAFKFDEFDPELGSIFEAGWAVEHEMVIGLHFEVADWANVVI